MANSILEPGKVCGCASTETELAQEKSWSQSTGRWGILKGHLCPRAHQLPLQAANIGLPSPITLTRDPVSHSHVKIVMEGGLNRRKKRPQTKFKCKWSFAWFLAWKLTKCFQNYSTIRPNCEAIQGTNKKIWILKLC